LRKKENISLVLVSLFCTFICLSACSRPEPKNTDKTIVLWEQEDAQVAPYIDKIAEAFKALPENIDVQVVRAHYQTEDLRQQFQAASLAGVAPDLLISPSDTAGVYAISGFIRPIDEYFDLTKYNKAAIESIALDGKTWGVPISNGNHLMLFYNKKLVKTPPKNTDELFKFCKKNKNAKKLEYCIAFDMGEPFWLMPWLGAFGGWPINNKTPTLDTKYMRQALKFYLDLKYEKKIMPMECDYNCMDSLFKESKVAFIINGDWAISSYMNHFKENFGIALLPKLSETDKWPTPMVSGKYFMISSEVSPKKMKLLSSFIDFYTNKENQIRQFKVLKRLPALKAAAQSSAIKKDEIAKISMRQILKGRPMPMATEIRAIWDSARNYMGLVMTKKMSIDEATKKMQKNAVNKIEEMNR
jgi:arabinogalactan oligomer / maltooligosaccharide transport system substrate-binding protein